ncbi:MAG: GH1 family beta-glucosidase [Phycisphaerales bacterium]|nr:GH1 family beta-glucosidase [Phycisphaerales bacterium]
MPFPDQFTWGVASAAYQIEGGANSDGRGKSVWDTFSETPGKVFEGHTGDTACGSYERVDEDVDLISQLGANGYRFSISWSRLFPNGVGEKNEAGFAYYDQLIDGLLAKGVQPWITLYHWDMPQALQDKGGWLNSESPVWFEEYTRAVVERYSDRVQYWFTLNEPQIFLGLGLNEGTHAPGLKLSRKEVLLSTHRALLSHGRAVKVIRENAVKNPIIGFAPVGSLHTPETDSPADIEVARKETFNIDKEGWTYNYSWYCDPVFLGHYPEQGIELFGDDVPEYTKADMELIHQPLDICGVNIYSAGVVRADEKGNPVAVPNETGFPMTMFKWTINPRSLYFGPKFLNERYGLPIVITENGLASMDWIHADGHVHDSGRIDYLTRYLHELRRACDDGVDIRGYFHWSIMDNFEWAEGYSLRFGLIYMDYQTLKRLPKDSYKWYSEVIRTNGEHVPLKLAPLM